jgi:hypothetical protein
MSPHDVGYMIGYAIGSLGSVVFVIRMIVDAFKYVYEKKIQRRKVVYIIFCSLRCIGLIAGILSIP